MLIKEQNSKIKLTIGIPVFRRPHLLKKVLESIVVSAKKSNLLFEVFISDDSPEAANQEICKHMERHIQNIRYSHNKKNIGIDWNIRKCFHEANGEYVLVIGEDDLVDQELLVKFDKFISISSPSLFILDYIYCTDDFSRDLGKPLFSFEQSPKRADLVLNFYKFGFIGSLIFNRQAFIKQSILAPVGTYFHHLSVLGILLFDENTSSTYEYIPGTNIRNRSESANSTSWVNQSLDAHNGYYSAVSWFEEKLSPSESKILHQYSKKIFRPLSIFWLLSKRADGAYNFSHWKKWHQELNIFKKCLLLGVSILPMILLRPIKFILISIKNYFK